MHKSLGSTVLLLTIVSCISAQGRIPTGTGGSFSTPIQTLPSYPTRPGSIQTIPAAAGVLRATFDRGSRVVQAAFIPQEPLEKVTYWWEITTMGLDETLKTLVPQTIRSYPQEVAILDYRVAIYSDKFLDTGGERMLFRFFTRQNSVVKLVETTIYDSMVNSEASLFPITVPSPGMLQISGLNERPPFYLDGFGFIPENSRFAVFAGGTFMLNISVFPSSFTFCVSAKCYSP